MDPAYLQPNAKDPQEKRQSTFYRVFGAIVVSSGQGFEEGEEWPGFLAGTNEQTWEKNGN